MTTSSNVIGLLHFTEPRRIKDHRGFFCESFSRRRYEELGITSEFVQDNHSMSRVIGTLRGLHFQAPPAAQGKLVRCGRGAIFDVAVDIRRGSPTYGKWEGYELTADNGHQLYIPVGFAHGFVTLEPNTIFCYKCTDIYSPEHERSLLWNDPALGIHWGVPNPLLSSKDAQAPLLVDFDSPFE